MSDSEGTKLSSLALCAQATTMAPVTAISGKGKGKRGKENGESERKGKGKRRGQKEMKMRKGKERGRAKEMEREKEKRKGKVKVKEGKREEKGKREDGEDNCTPPSHPPGTRDAPARPGPARRTHPGSCA